MLSRQDGPRRTLPGASFPGGALKAQGSFQPQDHSRQPLIVLFFVKQKAWLSGGTSGDVEAIRSGWKLWQGWRELLRGLQGGHGSLLDSNHFHQGMGYGMENCPVLTGGARGAGVGRDLDAGEWTGQKTPEMLQKMATAFLQP